MLTNLRGLTMIAELGKGVDEDAMLHAELLLTGDQVLLGCIDDTTTTTYQIWHGTWASGRALTGPSTVPNGLLPVNEDSTLSPLCVAGDFLVFDARFWSLEAGVMHRAVIAHHSRAGQWQVVHRGTWQASSYCPGSRFLALAGPRSVGIIDLVARQALQCQVPSGFAVSVNALGTHVAVEEAGMASCFRTDGGLECQWQVERSDSSRLLFAEDDLAVFRFSGRTVQLLQWHGPVHEFSVGPFWCEQFDPHTRRGFFVSGHDFVEVELTTRRVLTQGSFLPHTARSVDLANRRVATWHGSTIEVYALD